MECPRCGMSTYSDDGMIFEEGREIPHDIKTCKTRTNHVWCPICKQALLDGQPCHHYTYYRYRKGENEDHFIRLIIEGHEYGTFGRHKKQKRIDTSAGNTRTKNSICNQCGLNLDRLTAKEQEKHVENHKNNYSLEKFSNG